LSNRYKLKGKKKGKNPNSKLATKTLVESTKMSGHLLSEQGKAGQMCKQQSATAVKVEARSRAEIRKAPH
jgi:hypothetical protein